MVDTSKPLVLVTGGSGFIGAYCLLALLNSFSYRVRTTVRSASKSASVKAQLKIGGATEEAIRSIEFVEADLGRDDGWDAAVRGCTYVLHVASPFPPRPPKHEDELIKPAREGTLRVLKAARKAGVRRVVITSSSAAVWYGHADLSRTFTEADWSELNSSTTPYAKSKTLAERAAWDYIKKGGGDMQLATVNPVAVYGPLLSKEQWSTSIEVVVRLMRGSDPGVPQVGFGVVDVRDVADLHVRAMTDPKANGERFIASASDNEPIMMLDIAKMLKRELGPKASKVPTMSVPNLLARSLAFFDPTIRMIVPDLGKRRVVSSRKAKEVLGWQPMSPAASLVATAESLQRLGMLKT